MQHVAPAKPAGPGLPLGSLARCYLSRLALGRAAAPACQSLFDMLPDAILVLDPEASRVLEANQAAWNRFGPRGGPRSLAALRAALAADHPGLLAELLAQGRRAAAGGSERSEWQAAADGDPAWYELHLVAAPAGDQPQVVATLREITDRKASEARQAQLEAQREQLEAQREQLEARREQLEAQVRHAQKLESLGILAGGIAHDFNNLLAGMMGNAGLALRDLPTQSPAAERVRQLEAATLRASELTAQMLAYSGRGTVRSELLDLSRLADDMAALLSAAISKKATLALDLAPDLPAVEGDATQLRQVLMNLLTNASDALEDRTGTIRVRTGLRTLHGEASTAAPGGPLPPGDYVFVEVSDTGCGMDRATIDRMFEPFFTTRRTGRGLGLAAVRGILQTHRGTLQVASAPGRGSCLTALFPATTTPAPADGSCAEPLVNWRGAGTVLVIDDEPAVREVAALILREAGFEVLVAEDGAAGLACFDAHADSIQAVLLDLTMPRMSGEQVHHELTRRRPDLRILLSSGYCESEATRPFAHGALAGFVQKPYGPRELLAAVHQALADHPA